MKQPSKKGLISLTEFERRRNDLELFPDRERSLFIDLIEKCLEFLPEDRPNSLALVSNLQEIQSEIGPPQPDDAIIVPKISSEDSSHSHPIQSPPGLGEIELKLLEKEYQLKKYTEDLQAKEDKLKQIDEDIEEMTETIQEKNQIKSENEKQLKKVLKFNGLKWELQCHSVDYGSAISLSSNAVKCDGDNFIGIVSNDSNNILLLTTDSKSNPFYSCYEAGSIPPCAVTDGQTAYNSLQGYALIVCQGLLHMLGGEYVSNHKPTGKYSRKIITLTQRYNQWNECYPPMKTASASPAVVNYKECIVVVHKSGAVEVLNTSSTGSAWAEVHPVPYFPMTPSATLLGDLLVIWSGTLYYTDLRDMFTDEYEDINPPADWTTLPSPPMTSSSAHLTTLNEQLIAIGLGNTDGSRPLYAFNGATGKWSHIHNQCPGDIVLSIDSKTLLTFGPAIENKRQLCAYKGVLA